MPRGGTRQNAGRPRLPEGEEGIRFQVYLNKPLFDRLDTAAKDAGESRSQFIANCVTARLLLLGK